MVAKQHDGRARDDLRIVIKDDSVPRTPTGPRPPRFSESTACGTSPESRATSSEITIRNTVFVIEKPRPSCASTMTCSRSSMSPLSRTSASPLTRSPHSPSSPGGALANHEQLFDAALLQADPRRWPSQRRSRQVGLLAVLGLLASVSATQIIMTTFMRVVSSISTTELQSLSPAVVSSLLPTALFILGLGLGPLVLAPLSESESVGRRPVVVVSNALFAALNFCCSFTTNLSARCVLRLLAGMAGSSCWTLCPASIGDMFGDHRGRGPDNNDRDTAQGKFAIGSTLGMILGVVTSCLLYDRTDNLECILWIVAVLPILMVPLGMFFLRETYRPVLLARARMERRRRHEARWAWLFDRFGPGNRKAPNTGLFWELDDIDDAPSSRLSRARRSCCAVVHAATRPLRMLVRSPLLVLLSLCKAIAHGILYLHGLSLILLCARRHSDDSTDHSGLFAYNWHHEVVGPAMFTLGASTLSVGIILTLHCALLIWSVSTARRASGPPPASSDVEAGRRRPAEPHRQTPSHPQQPRPRNTITTTNAPAPFESGLLLIQADTPLIPIGLLIFALSAGRTHWIAPLGGAALTAVSLSVAHAGLNAYVAHVFGDHSAVDRHGAAWPGRRQRGGLTGDVSDGGSVEDEGDYAASALAATGLLAGIGGALIAIFGFAAVARLGYGWVNEGLAVLAAVCVPVPGLTCWWRRKARMAGGRSS